jgi:hypothetical protein
VGRRRGPGSVLNDGAKAVEGVVRKSGTAVMEAGNFHLAMEHASPDLTVGENSSLADRRTYDGARDLTSW